MTTPTNGADKVTLTTNPAVRDEAVATQDAIDLGLTLNYDTSTTSFDPIWLKVET